MKNVLIKLLAYLVMLPIVLIGVVASILWNTYLIIDYIGFRLKRKWKAGVKEVRKTGRYK